MDKKTKGILAAAAALGIGYVVIKGMVAGDGGEEGREKVDPIASLRDILGAEGPGYDPDPYALPLPSLKAPYEDVTPGSKLYGYLTDPRVTEVLQHPSGSREIVLGHTLTTPKKEQYIRDPHFTEIVTKPSGTKEIVLSYNEPTRGGSVSTSKKSSSTKVATSAQMSSTAARRAAFATATRFSKKRVV